MEIVNYILAGLFGAVFGSYSTLFAHRLPLNESCFGRYFGKKSHCPQCGYTIRTRELIPVLNWLFTFGKCKKCKSKIPKSHLFLEVFSVILYLICYDKFGFTEDFIIYSLISSACLILIVTDIKNGVFPFQILIFLLLLVAISRAIVDNSVIPMIYSSVSGIVASSIFYYLFFKKANGKIFDITHCTNYAKFILISSLMLSIPNFLIFFSVVMISFSFIAMLEIFNKKGNLNYGFCVIIPFLWIIFN